MSPGIFFFHMTTKNNIYCQTANQKNPNGRMIFPFLCYPLCQFNMETSKTYLGKQEANMNIPKYIQPLFKMQDTLQNRMP